MRLPRVLTVMLFGGACSGPPSMPDAGCTLPSDFPPDASSSDRDTVCDCKPTPFFHCQVEGGPRCVEGWSCFPKKASDGGYVGAPDGGVVCLC